MAFLRRRLTCFYCNNPSQTVWTSGLKSFHCQTCDATNHLDENGEITDPPTPKASAQLDHRRFAQGLDLGRSLSPSPGSQDSPFCQNCTNNQHFITQALAEYLPPPSDPKYREYERNLPTYKQNLEKRYPPVCTNCEPRVREQLQLAGYKAKSDYMRRMLNKTKSSSPARAGWTRKHLLGYIGAPFWTLSLLTTMMWHGFGVLAIPDDGLRNPDADASLQACLHTGIFDKHVAQHCLATAYSNMKPVLIANVLTIWWNPIMLRASNKADGLGEFYKLQFLLLAIRYGAWNLLGHNLDLDDKSRKATHAGLLVLNLVVTFVCLRAARPRAKKPVDFSQEIPPLIDPGSTPAGSSLPIPQNTPSRSKPAMSALLGSGFPISRLGTQPAQQSYQPPTPPPDLEFEDPDAMDIDQTPSQATMLYREGYRSNGIASSFQPGPSPAPLRNSPAMNTRNRTRRSSNQKRGGRSLPDWLSETTSTIADDDRFNLSDDDDEEYPVNYSRTFVPASARNRKSYDFAGPKLNVQKDETGLEGMFKDIFGLRDEPVIDTQDTAEQSMIDDHLNTQNRNAAPGNGLQTHTESHSSWTSWPLLILTAPVFAASFAIAVIILDSGYQLEDQAALAALIWIATTTSIRLCDTVNPKRAYWELSNVILYLAELATSVYMMHLRLQSYFESSSGSSSYTYATSTGPSNPQVGPDFEFFDEAPAGNSGKPRVQGTSVFEGPRAFVGFLAWVIGREAFIAFNKRKAGANVV